MSGLQRVNWRALSGAVDRRPVFVLLAVLSCLASAFPAVAQQRREREPNSVYAQRRAKLAAQVEGPILLLGFTGREEDSQSYVFTQEENFYYLTGHNEEEAAMLLLPGGKPWVPKPETRAKMKSSIVDGGLAPEILFLPAKNPRKEVWNGVRMSPDDPDIKPRTGFATVLPYSELRAVVEALALEFPTFYTVLPYQHELGGYPHEKEVVDWMKLAAPQVGLKDVRNNITDLRLIKSPTEIAYLRQAIDLSVDAQLAAMKMMRPSLWEYQIAAKMTEVHAMGGSEAEAYAPIVGAGPNSTALHYDKLSRKIQDGDIVVMDVGAQYSGYAADITRTIPANGKFTSRQREIYEIVLGAQNAALAALKPGAIMGCREKKNSLFSVAYNYINSHGKDQHGKPLGRYFIHGLGHNIGLNVHDPGDSCKPLQPGMVVTVEPGIYIPEENLGVRIEDDVLVTETGYELLSRKLTRDPNEIEKIMADAAKDRALPEKSAASRDLPASGTIADSDAIQSLVAQYAKSIDGADSILGAEIWSDSPDVSFVYPLGYAQGWEEIKRDVYEKAMRDLFSERKLTPRNISVHVNGEAAWAEFSWHFEAKSRKDGSRVTSEGRETQVYKKSAGRGWVIVHVHYSGVPVAGNT
jgi:Xaa-Pro aminopeptidase